MVFSYTFTKFENVVATVEYCRVTDRIFDFYTQKAYITKSFKFPIFKNNIHKCIKKYYIIVR